MNAEIDKVLEVAEKEGYIPDFIGLANRISKTKKTPGRSYLGLVALFAVQNEQMWHDIWNADPTLQGPLHKGKQTLYLDAGHTKINPNITISDRLYVFREYMKLWAARNHNWFSMQEGLAKQIIQYEETLLEGHCIG